jgi:hypothetical protein
MDWEFNNADIKKQLGIKRDETIAKYFRELITSGWISRTPRMTNGRPSGFFDYTLYYEPITKANTVNVELRNNATTQNADTKNQQLLENSSLNNTDISNNKDSNNPPISPKAIATPECKGGNFGVAQKVKQLNFNFSAPELNSIQNWFSYASQKSKTKSIPNAQVSALLQILHEHKSNGYDINGMITRSIGNGYKGVMSPTKEFLLNKSQSSAPVKTGRYKSAEYITPENKSQKNDLRNYLERCYMREMVDPRTGVALTNSQKQLFKLHFAEAKAKRISITEYIYRNEVLTGVCLLDQPLDGADTSSKPVSD